MITNSADAKSSHFMRERNFITYIPFRSFFNLFYKGLAGLPHFCREYIENKLANQKKWLENYRASFSFNVKT